MLCCQISTRWVAVVRFIALFGLFMECQGRRTKVGAGQRILKPPASTVEIERACNAKLPGWDYHCFHKHRVPSYRKGYCDLQIPKGKMVQECWEADGIGPFRENVCLNIAMEGGAWTEKCGPFDSYVQAYCQPLGSKGAYSRQCFFSKASETRSAYRTAYCQHHITRRNPDQECWEADDIGPFRENVCLNIAKEGGAWTEKCGPFDSYVQAYCQPLGSKGAWSYQCFFSEASETAGSAYRTAYCQYQIKEGKPGLHKECWDHNVGNYRTDVCDTWGDHQSLLEKCGRGNPGYVPHERS